MINILKRLFGKNKKQPEPTAIKSINTEKERLADELYSPMKSADFSELGRKDYLGMAADKKHKAKAAIRSKEFDVAWRYLHDQKSNYLQHASIMRFTESQILALDGTVHEDLANILRLEKKHTDAFVHIVYWAMSGNRSKKVHTKKLTAYFNRCKFKQASLSSLLEFYELSINDSVTFEQAKSYVLELY